MVSSGEKFQSGGWWPGQGRRWPGRGRSVTGHRQHSHEWLCVSSSTLWIYTELYTKQIKGIVSPSYLVGKYLLCISLFICFLLKHKYWIPQLFPCSWPRLEQDREKVGTMAVWPLPRLRWRQRWAGGLKVTLLTTETRQWLGALNWQTCTGGGSKTVVMGKGDIEGRQPINSGGCPNKAGLCVCAVLARCCHCSGCSVTAGDMWPGGMWGRRLHPSSRFLIPLSLSPPRLLQVVMQDAESRPLQWMLH